MMTRHAMNWELGIADLLLSDIIIVLWVEADSTLEVHTNAECLPTSY